MKQTDFERQMREGEWFHTLRLLPKTWCVVRVDGRSFTRFTSSRFDKPYDPRFRDHMIEVCLELMREMNGLYAFTESDEASVLFPPGWTMFDRELEKIVSVSAGLASAAFTHACGTQAHFDSRVWLGTSTESVLDYFMWRHNDAARCCLNGWAYWTLREKGKTYEQVTVELERRSVGWKNELLFQHGINFNDVPIWQKRGIGVYWEAFEVKGVDPRDQEPRTAIRRTLKTDLQLPMKEQYREFLREMLRTEDG